MSNLDSLLIEEYKRLENEKKAYISTLEHSPTVSLVYKPSGGKHVLIYIGKNEATQKANQCRRMKLTKYEKILHNASNTKEI